MRRRCTSLPSVSFLLLVTCATVGSAAIVPAGWRGPYRLAGTGTATIKVFGVKETEKFPVTRSMRAYAQKLDIGSTTYTYDDVTAVFQRSRYIPWISKNGGYNAFATAPVVLSYDGDDLTLNGKFIGRLARNSANKPVMKVKFTIFGQVDNVKVNIAIPLKGVKK